jgi:hypothetical protein
MPPSPIAAAACSGEQVRDFFQRVPRKVPQLNDLSRTAILACQFVKQIIDRKHLDLPLARRHQVSIEFDSLALAAMLHATRAPSSVDENPPHGFGGGAKEMGAPVPLRSAMIADEAQIRLMN